MSSDGALIFADPNSDLLHVGLNAPKSIPSSQAPRYFGVGIQNASRPSLPLEERAVVPGGDGLLRLQSRANYADGNMLHPWQNIDTHDARSRLRLRVAVSMQEDAKSATRVALDQLPKPDVAPNKSLMFSPIWTTWATSHADVTQESTLAVARDILKANKESGLPNGSIIEIDDRWQARYGELVFDPVKFPDPKAMVKELHDMGFLVTAWVMPFLQESSAACEEAKRLGYLVEGSQPPTEVGEVLTGWIRPNSRYDGKSLRRSVRLASGSLGRRRRRWKSRTRTVQMVGDAAGSRHRFHQRSRVRVVRPTSGKTPRRGRTRWVQV